MCFAIGDAMLARSRSLVVPFALVSAAFVSACGSSAATGVDAVLEPPPESCAASPSLARAQASTAWPGADALVVREVARSPLASAPFGVARPGEDRAELFADEASFDARKELSLVAAPFDAEREKLLVVQTWPRESRISFVREGATAVVRVERALPCLSAADLEAFRAGYPTYVYVAVPRDVDAVRVDSREVTYRVESPAAPTTSCERDSSASPAIVGGGEPSAYLDGDTIGLAFGGFSAMTGNVFTASSRDGSSFSPNGWSQERLLRFSERGPYADVYAPFLERTKEGYRLIARSRETERIVDGKIVRRGRHVMETSSTDGVSFGAERVLLDDPEQTSPSRVTIEGTDVLYVVGGDGKVRAAREADGKYAVDPNPVFTIDPVAHPDASLGVLAAEVRRVGDELWLVYAAGSGGLDRQRPLRSVVGLAKSRDGRSFVDAGGGWLVVQERVSEAGGFGAPSFVVKDGTMHVYFTMVNAASEPSIGHARCSVR